MQRAVYHIPPQSVQCRRAFRPHTTRVYPPLEKIALSCGTNQKRRLPYHATPPALASPDLHRYCIALHLHLHRIASHRIASHVVLAAGERLTMFDNTTLLQARPTCKTVVVTRSCQGEQAIIARCSRRSPVDHHANDYQHHYLSSPVQSEHLSRVH